MSVRMQWLAVFDIDQPNKNHLMFSDNGAVIRLGRRQREGPVSLNDTRRRFSIGEGAKFDGTERRSNTSCRYHLALNRVGLIVVCTTGQQ